MSNNIFIVTEQLVIRDVSDLGNGPNKPTTAAIIGEYSASCHDGTLVFTLVRARISDCDKNLTRFLATHY